MVVNIIYSLISYVVGVFYRLYRCLTRPQFLSESFRFLTFRLIFDIPKREMSLQH